MRDRIIVTLAAVLWIGGTLLGFGVIGGTEGVQSQGSGLFSDSATLIAPHSPAFSIWSVVYIGLAAYVVWQWLSTSPWAQVTRLPAAAAIALNGLWLIVVWLDWVLVSVLVIAAIVVALGILLRRINGLERDSWASDVVVAVTFGLYLGWICVATCANIASWLVGLGVDEDSQSSRWITVAVLAVVTAIAGWLLSRSDQRLFQLGLAAAVVWGISWVSYGRFVGDLRSDLVGYAALVAALCVAALGVMAILRTGRRSVTEVS